MPKLNDFQNSTVRLLDYLYFHDVAAMQSFSTEKLSIYKLTKITNDAKRFF